MWSVLFSGTVNLHPRQQYTMGAFPLSLCQYLLPFIFFIKKKIILPAMKYYLTVVYSCVSLTVSDTKYFATNLQFGVYTMEHNQLKREESLLLGKPG